MPRITLATLALSGLALHATAQDGPCPSPASINHETGAFTVNEVRYEGVQYSAQGGWSGYESYAKSNEVKDIALNGQTARRDKIVCEYIWGQDGIFHLTKR